MVAVTTLRDAAGAEVARELLAERGIAVEIRRLGGNAYFGSPTGVEYEVRVPADRVDEARTLLEGMADEMARAALAEAGVAPESEDERGHADLPPPELRPRKPAWAVALALVGPLPGCGLLYARAFALGWMMAGASLALFCAALVVGNANWLLVCAGLKAADVLVAPFAAARFNRSLENRKEQHASDS